jgi:hypothetical protein
VREQGYWAFIFWEDVSVIKRIYLLLTVSVISFLFSTSVYANVVFKLTVAQSELLLNEATTISVWANVEEQSSGLNGINTWQCDLVTGLSQGGIVQVTDVSIIAPSPRDTGVDPYSSINTPQVGDVIGLGASPASPGSDSALGVGQFSHLADITVMAQNTGIVEYSITSASSTGFYAWLKDYYRNGPSGNEYDSTFAQPYKAVFQSGNNAITVVPEPATILLLGVSSLLLKRRNTLS